MREPGTQVPRSTSAREGTEGLLNADLAKAREFYHTNRQLSKHFLRSMGAELNG